MKNILNDTREKVPIKPWMSFCGFSANRWVSTSKSSYRKLRKIIINIQYIKMYQYSNQELSVRLM